MLLVVMLCLAHKLPDRLVPADPAVNCRRLGLSLVHANKTLHKLEQRSPQRIADGRLHLCNGLTGLGRLGTIPRQLCLSTQRIAWR